MQGNGNARRSYGTGSLFEYRGAWYGKWRVGDRQIKRKVGPKRLPGTRQGLTRTQISGVPPKSIMVSIPERK